MDWLNENKDTLAIIGATISFLFGVYKYTALQKAKQLSTLFKMSEKIEQFTADPKTKIVHTLIDYTSYRFESFEYNNTLLKDVFISDELIAYALRPHKKGSQFHLFETHLRNLFDFYFTELEKYYYYIKIGAFDADFLRPYIGYYVDIIGNLDSNRARKELQHLHCLHNYISTYYPTNLVKFFGYFNFKIVYTEKEYLKPKDYDQWLSGIEEKIKKA